MPTESQYQFFAADKSSSLNTQQDSKSKLGPTSRTSSARPSLITRHSAAPSTSIEQRSPVDGRWPPEARTLTPEIKKEIARLFKRNLPSCNRPAPVAGHDDWYTLIGSPSLDFCPDCIDDMFERTIYRAAFRRSPPRNLNTKVQCAFGSPWIRLAWLLTLERERTDLMLLRDMAEVDETSEPCAGSHQAVRSWYGLRDPEGYFVRNFHVCYSDIRKIERLLPTLSGLFVRLPNRASIDKRLCAMRADANRFPVYMKALLTMHEKAHETRKLPDQMPMIQLVERKTRIRECSRDNLLLGERWHFIPELPHFTVCEDCFECIVEPEARKSKGIAVRFSRTSRPIYGEAVGSSCQLYSPRMRKVFKNAIEDDSIKYLHRKTKERRDNELRLQEKYQDVLRRAKRLSAGRAAEDEGKRLDWELEKITEEWQDKWE
ncbi:hypothetical protein K431DRAFT_218763 [Polychaeton citri CBS 116435]|uniref:Uncharacterized protein n=1 Tax=Polychaeton citri CBS 116435 TaxID=1314669 RepID=A0A9P4QEE0_9PEZI|nr:hypothetical protein K431DRAFT_218763 [Polychaeton citri CBS 116435]